MKKTANKRKANRPVVETLEARILYSADFAPGILDTPQTDGVAEQRTLAPSGEFAQSASSDVQTQHRELVVVASNARDYQKLVEDIVRQGGEGRSIEVVVLDADQDGIAQITNLLARGRI